MEEQPKSVEKTKDEIIFQKIRDGKYEVTDTNELTTITDDIADILVKNADGWLYLNHLTSISDSVAEILAKHKGSLELNGLWSLSDTVAERLSKHVGDLNLGQLQSLSDTAAEHLSKLTGDIGLDSLKEFSDEAAKHLGEQGNAYLSGDNQKRVEKFMTKEAIRNQHRGI